MQIYDKNLQMMEWEKKILKDRIKLLRNPYYAIDLEEKVQEFKIYVRDMRKWWAVLEGWLQTKNKEME